MLRSLARSYRDAFSGLPRQVWVLALCLFVNRLGMMVLPFLELYLTEERHLGVDEAGRLVALYGVGSILGVTSGGWLTDRFGSRRVQLASLLGNALLLLVLWRTRTELALGAAILAVALASDTFRPANGAAISAAAGPAVRARSFSLMSLAVNLGLSVGLPLGGALAEIDFDWLFWIDAGTALFAAATLWRFGERGVARGRAVESAVPRPAVPSPWRDSSFVVVIVLQCATATVLFQFFGALPVFLEHDVGLDKAGIGLVLALNTALTALFGMQAVRWVERRGELAWFGVGSFLICAGYGVNGIGHGLTPALASIVVWSVGEMFFFPLGASFASRRAPAGAEGRYMSAFQLGLALPLVLAPFLGTWLYEAAGPRVLWASCAGVGVLVAASFAMLLRRVRSASRS